MTKITLKRYNGESWEELKVASEWDIVGGKPSTFPPSGHGHNASDINEGVLSIDVIPNLNVNKITGLGNIATKNLSSDYNWTGKHTFNIGPGNSKAIEFKTSSGALPKFTATIDVGQEGTYNRDWTLPSESGTLALDNVFNRSTKGLVPNPGGSGTSRFLREDGSWAAPDTSIPVPLVLTQGAGSATIQAHNSFNTTAGLAAFQGTSSAGNVYLSTFRNNIRAAVYAEQPTYASGTKYAGYFNGDVRITGNLTVDGSSPGGGLELIRDRGHGASLTSVGSGTSSGYVVLDKLVSPGDTLMIEVSKHSSGTYNPKIVTVTVGTSSSIASTTDADYLNSWSYFNGTNMGIYTFTCWAGGSSSSSLYFGAKRYIQGSFSGSNINWTTNIYTLYVGRVWRVNR